MRGVDGAAQQELDARGAGAGDAAAVGFRFEVESAHDEGLRDEDFGDCWGLRPAAAGWSLLFAREEPHGVADPEVFGAEEQAPVVDLVVGPCAPQAVPVDAREAGHGFHGVVDGRVPGFGRRAARDVEEEGHRPDVVHRHVGVLLGEALVPPVRVRVAFDAEAGHVDPVLFLFRRRCAAAATADDVFVADGLFVNGCLCDNAGEPGRMLGIGAAVPESEFLRPGLHPHFSLRFPVP